MALFGKTDDELRRRVEALEAQRVTLQREWDGVQLDIIELTRRAQNALRSLARAARHAELAEEKKDAAPGIDPVSAAIFARRRRGLQAASGE